jgi:hypothetical protein
MVGFDLQAFVKQLNEVGDQGSRICRSLEIGQAVQPCSQALAELFDDNPSSSSGKSMADRCSWLKITLKQAHERTGRELTWLRDRLANIEPVRNSAVTRSVVGDKEPAKLKEQLTVAFAKIDKSLALASETSIQPLGSWTRILRETTCDFDLCDMEKTQSAASLKLGINAGHLSKITRRIEHELRTHLNRDLRQLQDETSRRQRNVLLGVGVPEQELDRFVLPKLLERDVWRSIENLIAVGKECQIEFQRRSIFDILTAGRQKVFMVIMFLSLMGRMGLPNLFASPASKLIFGLFLGSVMISSMFSSIMLWRREKIEQGEKELKKIRETLLQDGMKIVEQTERNKLTAAREYLKEVFTSTESAFKLWTEETAHLAKSKADIEQAGKEAHRKAVDERLKSMTEAERSLAKLIERVTEIEKQYAAAIVGAESSSSTSVPTMNSPLAPSTASPIPTIPIPQSSNPSRANPASRLSNRNERLPSRISGLAARREKLLSAKAS